LDKWDFLNPDDGLPSDRTNDEKKGSGNHRREHRYAQRPSDSIDQQSRSRRNNKDIGQLHFPIRNEAFYESIGFTIFGFCYLGQSSLAKVRHSKLR